MSLRIITFCVENLKMIKMIAVDMDGTFLDEKGTYDYGRFEKVIEKLEDKKILFVVATGNQISRMRYVFGEQTDRLAYVTGNGSHVIVNKKTQAFKHFSFEQVSHFFDYYNDMFKDFHIVISSPEESYMLKDAYINDNLKDKESLDYYNRSFPGVHLVNKIDDIPKENLNKITMKTPPKVNKSVVSDFREEFPDLSPVVSGFGAIDILSKGIDKGWGLKQIMKSFNINSEEFMAFGDGDNDLEMLKLAKYSYAMENASQNIKDAANFLAPSHRDNGVLQVIENYLNNL